MSEQTACRGIRGAITVEDGVAQATARLLDALQEANGCRPDQMAAVVFTVTDDLPDANPAAAARAGGWHDVPLLVVREHGGGPSLPRCLRVLALWNTARRQDQIQHVYLGGAEALRPDIVEGGTHGRGDEG
ncbi:MAG TPA: chorismate mutase [Actinomycetota bacterium]|jgi:chorismate mutase